MNHRVNIFLFDMDTYRLDHRIQYAMHPNRHATTATLGFRIAIAFFCVFFLYINQRGFSHFLRGHTFGKPTLQASIVHIKSEKNLINSCISYHAGNRRLL